MKYIFQPNPEGNAIRNSDDVRGMLTEFPDDVTIQPASRQVDPDDFTLLPAEPEPEPAPPSVAECVRQAEAHIAASFSSFILMDGLKRIGEHKEADTLNLIPKTIAIATWVETVKQTALAGSIDFPPAPHAVVEVLAE